MKFLSDLKFNRKKSLENQQFLKKGRYVLLPNIRTYVRVGSYRKASKSFPQGRRGLRSFIRWVVGFLFSFRVSENGDFGGEILYFSTISNCQNRDCKIFSFDKKQVLILSANQGRFDLYRKNRERNENRFPLPHFYEMNDAKLYFIEEYLCDVVKEKHSLDAAIALFEFYEKYYRVCLEKGDLVLSKEGSELLCDGVTAEDCPVLYLHHADLSVDNFIYANNRLIFIDFDHEDYYPPFYDVFFLIFNQAFSFLDDRLLETLNSGGFDRFIIAYSNENGVSPIQLIKNCMTYMYHKRMQTYSAEKISDVKNVFGNIIKRAKERMTDGRGK